MLSNESMISKLLDDLIFSTVNKEEKRDRELSDKIMEK